MAAKRKLSIYLRRDDRRSSRVLLDIRDIRSNASAGNAISRTKKSIKGSSEISPREIHLAIQLVHSAEAPRGSPRLCPGKKKKKKIPARDSTLHRP